MPQQFDHDFLVLGSGIAGLTFALEVAPVGRVAVITKKHRAESNTNYAQGGIAVALSGDDSLELHVRDTLQAGAGLCREPVVRTILGEGPELVRRLVDWGVRFSRDPKGTGYDLGREGGHSARRVLHAGDITGREIERALLEAAARQPNITILENRIAIDLITSRKLGRPGPNQCLGCYVLNEQTGEVDVFAAPVTLLATGGSGKVYLYTSNPDIATGDGVAMAYRAGARIVNMEFVQFHPTCLYEPRAKTFLISEAVRGEGGILRRMDGLAFMQKYHPQADLAPRDIVARAIDAEMKRTGTDYVLLDITHRDPEFVRQRFPNIYQRCLEYGFDMTRQPLPVVPAAHYQCGGVETDVNGQTDLLGLLAAGEVAHTGLHGANRLASNSLLEAVVVARRAAARARELWRELKTTIRVPAWESGDAADADELVVISHNWDEIRRLMWDYVGIVRTDKRLLRARTRIQNLQREINQFYWDYKVTPDLIELRNLALVAELIIESALRRKESRGLHYTLDYPSQLPLARDTVLCREGKEPVLAHAFGK
ncbi:MAG: L-aspartate oxidase [Verrucomicrobiae bacterium]|nr:L-aspartate oxidase [Verrucomicrobiae bacterium]